MKEPCVHSAGNRFWHAVARQRFPPAELDFQHAGFVLYQKAHRLPPEPPLLRKIRDTVMHFESCIGLDQMRLLVLNCCPDHVSALPPFRGDGSDLGSTKVRLFTPPLFQGCGFVDPQKEPFHTHTLLYGIARIIAKVFARVR
jgi:hypothetical protein